MQETQRMASIEVKNASEEVVDGIRVIRDSLLEISVKTGIPAMTSPLLEGKTVNEAAEVLHSEFEGRAPEESRRLARELVHAGSADVGTEPASFMDVHWALDSAVLEWEQGQKHTEFPEDPDSE